MICIVSLRKIYLAYSGDRTTVPSLLVRALYRATTEQSKRSVEYPVIFKAPLTPTGLGDIGCRI